MGKLEGSGRYEEPGIQVKMIFKWFVNKLERN